MDELKEIFDQAKVINQLDTQTGNLIYCYDIFMFLLGEKSNNCKFSEFCKYYNMADGNLARAITLFLGYGPDASVEKAVEDAKIILKPIFTFEKSDYSTTKVEFLEGNHQIYQEFCKYLETGLVKSLERPGKDSKEAYMLAGVNSFLFVKPNKKEQIIKNEIKSYNLAKEMSLDKYILPVCSVKIIKSIENQIFSNITPLLPFDSVSLEKMDRMKPGSADGLLLQLIEHGDAHKLALWDYLIKNNDRHKNNIYCTPSGKLILIDQGESFKNHLSGHIPGYLRLSNFKQDKVFPLTKSHVELKKYVNELNVSDKDIQKTIDELKKTEERMDVAINKLWQPFVGK